MSRACREPASGPLPRHRQSERRSPPHGSLGPPSRGAATQDVLHRSPGSTSSGNLSHPGSPLQGQLGESSPGVRTAGMETQTGLRGESLRPHCQVLRGDHSDEGSTLGTTEKLPVCVTGPWSNGAVHPDNARSRRRAGAGQEEGAVLSARGRGSSRATTREPRHPLPGTSPARPVHTARDRLQSRALRGPEPSPELGPRGPSGPSAGAHHESRPAAARGRSGSRAGRGWGFYAH